MKISAKQYAEALLGSIEGKSKDDAVKSVGVLLGIMKENKDFKKTKDMIVYFSKLWDEKEGKARVEVLTATEADKATKAKIKKYISKKLNIDEVEMDMVIDKSIMGGVVIRRDDKVYDGSLRTRLYELKKNLNK